MTSEKLKPTPGPWTYLAGTSTCEKVLGADGKVVADGWWCRDVAAVDANSRLIAEAGTVFHECGLSPRELQERCSAMEAALNACKDALEWVVEQGGGPACEHEGGVVCFCKENNAINAARAALAPALQSHSMDARDAAFEAVRKRFCKLPRYSFLLDGKGNVRRFPNFTGNWVEFEAVHTLFEPAAVKAAMAAAQAKKEL